MSEWVVWEGEEDYTVEKGYEPEDYSIERRHEQQKGLNTKFCAHCGSSIHVEAEICPNCGVRVERVRSNDRKNPGLAAVFSFLFVGLGQIYNGQIGKGVVFFIFGVILTLSMLFIIGLILYPIFWIYNIYDAYNTAKRINAGEIRI
jgi:TM2 domain-containing membrane protein YozV